MPTTLAANKLPIHDPQFLTNLSMSPTDPKPPEKSRYIQQQRFEPIGQPGQAQLEASSVLVCGCGALGSMIAERLVRAGVGRVRIVDRDWVELSNLQRQTLFNEKHAREAIPKAIAAFEILTQINDGVTIEPIVDDVTCDNIRAIAAGCDLIMDGSDNFETRFLINDYCVRFGVPWIHGGCLGASGQVLAILPGQTACFRCLMPELPPREAIQTCDSAGVLGPAVGLIACWQAAEALKLLSGNESAVSRELLVLDCWSTSLRKLELHQNAQCPTCGRRDFPFLDGRQRTESTVLCGKNAVQLIRPAGVADSHDDLEALARRLTTFGRVDQNKYYVRLKTPGYQLTLFRGGRTVVEGTNSPAEAKSFVARTLGQ